MTASTIYRPTSTQREVALAAVPDVAQLAPSATPPSVAEISARLFAAYNVERGTVHMAGCTLELHPIVRVSGRSVARSDASPTDDRDVELFVSGSGELIDHRTICALGLQDRSPCEKPPRTTEYERDRLVRIGRRAFESHCERTRTAIVSESTTVEIVWCRWAAGKLRFSVGARSADVHFADWAAHLSPPPFVCPYSGAATYKLAALDDGRIVAADELDRCEQSQARVLRCELIQCGVTGKRVSPTLIEYCPATGRPLLREQMVPCPQCLILVSPHAVKAGKCAACAMLNPVSHGDPRLCLVLGEHPVLDRWRRWQLAETPQAYVLRAEGVLHQLLLVFDKQTLEALRVAHRGRLLSPWREIPLANWRDWLR